jgi:hypothetical protein
MPPPWSDPMKEIVLVTLAVDAESGCGAATPIKGGPARPSPRGQSSRSEHTKKNPETDGLRALVA